MQFKQILLILANGGWGLKGKSRQIVPNIGRFESRLKSGG